MLNPMPSIPCKSSSLTPSFHLHHPKSQKNKAPSDDNPRRRPKFIPNVMTRRVLRHHHTYHSSPSPTTLHSPAIHFENSGVRWPWLAGNMCLLSGIWTTETLAGTSTNVVARCCWGSHLSLLRILCQAPDTLL